MDQCQSQHKGCGGLEKPAVPSSSVAGTVTASEQQKGEVDKEEEEGKTIIYKRLILFLGNCL